MGKPLSAATLPQTTLIGNVYLSDASPRDKTWDSHRASTQLLSGLYDVVGLTRYAERADACSGKLWFGVDPARGLTLATASFCRLRYCPVCQWRRSRMWVARFLESLPSIQAAHPTSRWLLLTLTVRNCELTDLRSTILGMNAAWKRLIERKDWPALGFVRSTEVTKSATDQAHPHFHVLLMVKPSYFTHGYVKHDQWAERWRDALRVNYTPSVRVQAVKPLRDNPENVLGHLSAVLEVFKYQVKTDDVLDDAAWTAELTKQTHKLRFLATGGLLKNFLRGLEKESNEDLVRAGDDPLSDDAKTVTHCFEWQRPEKRYRKTRTAVRRNV